MRTISVLGLAAALLAGCVAPPLEEGAKVARRVDDAVAPDARIHYDQVVILDRTLQNDRAGKLAVERQGARRTPTGTVLVTAQLRNRTDFTQAIEARVSFFDPSTGTVGEGSERGLDALRYPSELHLDARLEIVTPSGVLYAANPTHLRGRLADVEFTGTELDKDGGDIPLVTAAGECKAWLSGLELQLGEAQVGKQAHMTPVPVA